MAAPRVARGVAAAAIVALLSSVVAEAFLFRASNNGLASSGQMRTRRAPVVVAAQEEKASAGKPLDMNSPEVIAMYEKVMKMDMDDVTEELLDLGIPPPPTMDDTAIRLMLMECRVRIQASHKLKEDPGPDASPYEKLLWEKPFIRQYEDELWRTGDTQSVNVFREYINTKEKAISRYGGAPQHEKIFAKAQEFIDMPAFTSKKLAFGGFPAMLGADAVKAELAKFGELAKFQVTKTDDVEIIGIVEFETQEGADAAVKKWDGADMGMDTTLSLSYLE